MEIISFYSFKGGAGRTVCCANMIPILAAKYNASKEHPILIMDMDMDSAGLTHLLDMYKRFEKSDWVSTNLLLKGGEKEIKFRNSLNIPILFNKDFYGNQSDEEIKEKELSDRELELKKIVKILINNGLSENKAAMVLSLNIRKSVLLQLKNSLNNNIEDFINNLMGKLEFAENAEEILDEIESLLPASGMVDISRKFGIEKGSLYFIGTQQTRLDDIVSGTAKGKLLDLVTYCDIRKFSAIIIDSASGIQQIANVIHEIENGIIVYCLRLTNQFRRGTTIRLEHFIETSQHFYGTYKVILLPVALPIKEYKKHSALETLKNYAVNDLQDNVKNLKSRVSSQQKPSVTFYDDFIEAGIPEVESFKWDEKILKESNMASEDELLALQVFNKLGEIIIEISKNDK